MYGVIRQYRVDSSIVDETIRRAGEEFAALISNSPGFVSYTMLDAGAEGLITLSTFEDEARAEESVKMAGTWIKENLDDLLHVAPQVTRGQFSIRNVPEAGQQAYFVLRRYKFDPSQVEEIIRRVSTGLAPLLSKARGFAGYGVVDAGEGVVVSISAFSDQAAAETSNKMALGWIKTNLAELAPKVPSVITAEAKVRRSKAVAGAR